MNLTIARVHGVEKMCLRKRHKSNPPMTNRGVIYVTRTVVSDEGVAEVPLRLDRQDKYTEWTGCWSAL